MPEILFPCLAGKELQQTDITITYGCKYWSSYPLLLLNFQKYRALVWGKHTSPILWH